MLTSGTNNIYPYPYIDINDQGHRFRSGSPLTNYPHAESTFQRFFLHNFTINITFDGSGFENEILTNPTLIGVGCGGSIKFRT